MLRDIGQVIARATSFALYAWLGICFFIYNKDIPATEAIMALTGIIGGLALSMRGWQQLDAGSRWQEAMMAKAVLGIGGPLLGLAVIYAAELFEYTSLSPAPYVQGVTMFVAGCVSWIVSNHLLESGIQPEHEPVFVATTFDEEPEPEIERPPKRRKKYNRLEDL